MLRYIVIKIICLLRRQEIKIGSIDSKNIITQKIKTGSDKMTQAFNFCRNFLKIMLITIIKNVIKQIKNHNSVEVDYL